MRSEVVLKFLKKDLKDFLDGSVFIDVIIDVAMDRMRNILIKS